jgi:hypothetical protein
MKNPPYPITGEQVRPSWHDRRPFLKILLGTAILALMLVAVGIPVFLASHAAMRQHPIYKEAVDRATSSPAVIAVLGAPVQPAWLFSGDVGSRNQFGYADFEIPLKGSKGAGTLIVRSLQIRGNWEVRRLRLEVKGIPDIDLLAVEPTK